MRPPSRLLFDCQTIKVLKLRRARVPETLRKQKSLR